MQNLGQVARGAFIALVSTVLLLGGISLSLVEGNTIAPVFTQLPVPTLPPVDTLPPTATFTLQAFVPPPADSPTPLLPTWTPTLPLPPTNCPPPAGWVAYVVRGGDTLDKLAILYRVSTARISQANCLLVPNLISGVVIYLPPVPTQTPVPCGPPNNWVSYIVRHGDTLYHLGQAYGVTVADLQRANCMGSFTLLHTGQILYVPYWATRTPSPTASRLPTMTNSPTSTPTRTLVAPTATLPTSTLPPTSTNTATPTSTPVPSDTLTEPPTATSTPTPTPTP